MTAKTFALPPQYAPHDVERRLYARWLDAGVFTAHAAAPREREPYVTVIPPPNVTAVLHMGHGLNNVIQDVLIRCERMRGREALWLPGTDHAGIATQNVVERMLAAEGRTRFDVGREAFVERVWAFVRETGPTILEQLKVIGCSCDWSRTRFTFDAAYSRSVREVFVRLWEEGLIYRGHRVIHWCPRCLTALSDEEAEFVEETGQLYYIRYPVEGGPAPFLTVATTRPETMLGDTPARGKIVGLLKDRARPERVEPHRHAVRHCYRCDSVVEPRLSDQWFVKMQPLALPALRAYREGTIRFVPERWGATYEHWMTNIRDWNISRQLWWGHRIPVFTCTKCAHQWADRSDPAACPRCGGPVTQDPDVLDTWFSSWLWPFATFGWPDQTADLERFYPGHTLVTAPEILFFWVARMIMAGYHFLGREPFRTGYLHGTGRDTQHRKMSKALGNGIDPRDVTGPFCAHSLRWAWFPGSSLGAPLSHEPHDPAG